MPQAKDRLGSPGARRREPGLDLHLRSGRDGAASLSPAEVEGLPISEVSRLLGVPVPTLRSWELRYGIPDTSRSVGNHRRYFPEQLHALRLMRDEIVRGKRASAAANSVRTVLGMDGPARQLVDEFLDQSKNGDPAGLHEVLSRAQRTLGLGATIDDVLMPSMRQIGLWWETGRCDITEEHLTTESVRGWLNDVTSFAPTPNQAGPILLACGPSDLHTLGLEALATIMRYRGWTCRVLGARVPSESLFTAARGTGAVAVVVASHVSSGRLRAVESLRRCDRAGMSTFYAGNGFGSPKSRVGVPGLYLGTRLDAASGLIEGRLLSTPPRSRMVRPG